MALVAVFVFTLQTCVLWSDKASAEETIIVRLDRNKSENGEIQMDGGNNENNLDKMREVRVHSYGGNFLFIYCFSFLYFSFFLSFLFLSFLFPFYFILFIYLYFLTDVRIGHRHQPKMLRT